MDSSHVSLVALFMRAEGFAHYRADRNISLGITLASMAKVTTLAHNCLLIVGNNCCVSPLVAVAV